MNYFLNIFHTDIFEKLLRSSNKTSPRPLGEGLGVRANMSFVRIPKFITPDSNQQTTPLDERLLGIKII